MLAETILVAEGLRAEYPAPRGGTPFRLAVDHLSVRGGETLAVVGRSGCGKSTLLSVLSGQMRPTAGTTRIRVSGELVDFYGSSRRVRRMLRRHFGIVFQDTAALNPRRQVIEIVTDPLDVHKIGKTAPERREAARVLLRQVGLSEPFDTRSPAELSGGQRQRVAIARALVTQAPLVFLDEPTSALDVSVQAAVIQLLQELKAGLGVAYVFVTHDLALACHLADRIAVMDDGCIVEEAAPEVLLRSPGTVASRRLIAAARDGHRLRRPLARRATP